MMIKQIIILMLMLILASNVRAEIYQYKDSSGNLVFTDDISKVPSGERSSVTTKNGEDSSSSTNIMPRQPKSSKPPINRNLSETPYGSTRCPGQSKYEAERAIKATWHKMKGVLLAGNTEKALEYFSMNTREYYRHLLTIEYKNKIKALFAGYDNFMVDHIDDIDAEGGAIRN